MRSQYGYELNASDYAALLEHPDLPPAQILAILHRQFQPVGHPVPDGQILAAIGLSAVRRPAAVPRPGNRRSARSSQYRLCFPE